MTDLPTQGNSEWLSLKEAAKIRGVSSSAIGQQLRGHPLIREKHYKEIGKTGYVSRDGLALLEFRKDAFRGNQHIEKPMLLDDAKVAQDKTALAMAEFMKDPIIIMRMEQMKLAEQVNGLVRFQEQFQPMLEDATPVDITASQRQFLNERVRNLAIKSALPFGTVWGWVHDHVGKRPLESYVFEDYPIAAKFLKKIYSQYRLDW